MLHLSLTPCWTEASTPFRHTWEDVVNVDQFRWLVRHDLLAQLARVRDELGGRHVRAVGMFDDELRVLCPGPESVGAAAPRPARTNWQVVDYVWDELLERGLSPMVTTSFIPSRLASGATTVFTTQGCTSPPRDYAAWARLVQECVRHAVDRYGLACVRRWYFEVWNEPNLRDWFWGADQAEFFRLWSTTYRAIKEVDGSLRVGGPSTARAEWIADFVEYGRRHDCPADYLTLHIYNNDGEAAALAPFDGPQADLAGTSPDLAAGVVRGARRLADQLGFRNEIHFNEWGSSWRGFEPARESANEAAFVVRLLAEVSQQADQFAYWCVSDIYDQVGYGRETFHGNYGLLNLQGLRKPAFHAFHLLHRLDARRIRVDGQPADALQGAIVTRGAASAHVLVYSYRAEASPSPAPLQVTVELPAGASGPGELCRVDSRENNVLARWRELGAPAYLHPAERAALAAADATRPSQGAVTVGRRGDHLVATFTMESPGIALLAIPLGEPARTPNL